MNFLSEMTDEQVLVMYSGNPLGLFPSVIQFHLWLFFLLIY
jgi:hypothetical protein